MVCLQVPAGGGSCGEYIHTTQQLWTDDCFFFFFFTFDSFYISLQCFLYTRDISIFPSSFFNQVWLLANQSSTTTPSPSSPVIAEVFCVSPGSSVADLTSKQTRLRWQQIAVFEKSDWRLLSSVSSATRNQCVCGGECQIRPPPSPSPNTSLMCKKHYHERAVSFVCDPCNLLCGNLTFYRAHYRAYICIKKILTVVKVPSRERNALRCFMAHSLQTATSLLEVKLNGSLSFFTRIWKLSLPVSSHDGLCLARNALDLGWINKLHGQANPCPMRMSWSDKA